MSEQNYKEFFEESLNIIHQEYISQGKEDDFRLWFNLSYVEDTISEITVSVASQFMWDQMVNRGNVKKIQQTISELTGQNIVLKHIIKKRVIETNNTELNTYEQKNTPIQNLPKTENKIKEITKHPQLREDFTFENFIPGDNSIYPYNASLAAAKNPGKAYNPILIYGGVGLGKTHLMQAIGNYIYNEKGEKIKLSCLSAESFTNEFVKAIKEQTTDKFKNKYRKLDILLLDDIQFLQGKDSTQEELFHTFNELYDRDCQIVFTCDRPISELKGITDRLRTRFSRGLNVDLQPPNFENRKAILQKKLELKGKSIPDEVIDFVAKNIQTNVRDMESSLTKLIGYAEIVGKNLTIEIAQQQLRDIFNNPFTGTITVEHVQKTVANHFNISLADIKGKKRDKKFVIPRQIAIYISRELTEHSYPELGNEFGGKDHTTIMHSYEKVETQLKTDSSLSSTINLLTRQIKDFKN